MTAAPPTKVGRAASSWAAPVAVALLAVVASTFRLGRRPFWTDEAYNVVLVRDPWTTFVRTIGDREPSQAVYLIFLKPWIALVGHGEWQTRAPSALFGVVAAALVVVLGRQLFDAVTGLLAGVLTATNAALVEWSQYARTYSFAALAAVVTTLGFLRVRRETRLWPWVLYGALGAVSIYVHFYAGFVLVAHAIAWGVDEDRAPLSRLLVAWAVIAAGLIPFAAYLVVGTRSPVDWIPEPGLGSVWSALRFASGHNDVLLAAAALGVVAALSQLGPRGRVGAALLVGWITVPILGGLLVSAAHPALVPRFLVVAVPAVSLLAAVTITALPARAVAVLGLAVILAVSGWRLADVYTKNPEDWRSASAAAKRDYAGGSSIAVLPGYAWRALAIYAPSVPRVSRPVGPRLALVIWGSHPRELAQGFLGRAPYSFAGQREFGDRNDSVVIQHWRRRR